MNDIDARRVRRSKKQAWSLNIEATGSELVGLAPLEALLKAGRFYAGEESLLRLNSFRWPLINSA